MEKTLGGEGDWNENAKWLKEIELAISQRVPLSTLGAWTLETNEAVKVILVLIGWLTIGGSEHVHCMKA